MPEDKDRRPPGDDAWLPQLLINSITDYAIYMIDLDGRVASWNSGAARLKGYSAEEIIGQPYAKFFIPEDQAREFPQQALADRGADRAVRASKAGVCAPTAADLLGAGGHRPGARSRRQAHRLRQGHPRHDRAAARAGPAARKRAPVPPPRRVGDRAMRFSGSIRTA